MSGGKQMKSSVSFTLPISCQICLGKVKEPVTCSNQHVFCNSCMNIWLDRNSQCPTCRVDITPQSPIKPVLGGELSATYETAVSQSTSRELRRARYVLVQKEYEDELFHLDKIIEEQRKEISNLKEKLTALAKQPADCESAQSTSSETLSCHNNIKDVDSMLDMTKKLQEATRTFSKTKKELAEARKVNQLLTKKNHDFKLENQRMREEVSIRSPMKFGRLTVATLQSRLDASEKQVIQLQKALERNDQYTEQLETELKMLKLRVATNQANYPDQERGDPDGLIVGSSIINDTESSSGLTNCVQYSLFADGANKPEGDGITAPSAKLHHLQLVTPAGNSQFFARSDTPSIDIDDNSVPSSSSLNIDSLMDEFVAPARSPSHDAKVSFSRRLQFDDNMLQDENTVSSSYEFENVCEPCLDLSVNALDVQSDSLDGSLMFNDVASETNCSISGGSSLKRSSSDRAAYYAPSPSSGLKTKINAGGACITMSELNDEERSKFVRPSSAPSRTFLLSGSKFSALRPIGPDHDTPTNDGFQPVKCISPLLPTNHASQDATQRSARTEAVSSHSCSRLAEEQRSKDILSRVNILKRKNNHVKVLSPAATVPTTPGDGRRKQKFSFKRTGEMLFESPVKSPKL